MNINDPSPNNDRELGSGIMKEILSTMRAEPELTPSRKSTLLPANAETSYIKNSDEVLMGAKTFPSMLRLPIVPNLL